MATTANMGSVVILQHVSSQTNRESLEDQSNQVPAHMPKPLRKFFQGKPEVLGVTQLFIGINHILFGIVLNISVFPGQWNPFDLLVHTGVFYWSGIAYVLSGSLSIAASYKPTIGKVKASLALNIISCIAVMGSVITFAIYFVILTYLPHYRYYDSHYFCAYEKSINTCEWKSNTEILFKGILSTLFLFTALEFCIALSTSIFGCKTECGTSYIDKTVIIYQTTSVNDSAPALSSDGEVRMH